MNKVLHFNLTPWGAEKTPNLEKLALLHAFMMGNQMDVAWMIWDFMKEFAKAGNLKVNLHSPI